MNKRMKMLHHLLHAEEGEHRDDAGNHIAHQVFGKWHIAFGHLLDAEQSEEELEIMGLEDELDGWVGFTVNDEQAYALFEIDVADAYDGSLISFTGEELDALSDERWAVIQSMCFQMGSVSKFKSFVAAVKAENWQRAADEMLWSNGLRKRKRSAWFIETPRRAERAAAVMLTGVLEGFEPSSVVVQANEEQAKLLASVSNTDLANEFLRRMGV